MSGSGVAGSSLSGAEDTVKDFWASRPRRPRHGRKVAGVAVGIANRYGVDPVIVRVALVVATLFGGGGVLFYLLGWVFLAEEGDEVAPFEAMTNQGRSSTSTGLTVVLCLAMIPAFGLMAGGNGWLAFGGFSGFLSLLLLFLGIYLLHRGRGADFRPAPVSTDSSYAFSATAPLEQQHEGWDPLGAAPLAWDLPEQPDYRQPAETPPPMPPHRPRSKAGVLVFGLTVLTAVVCVLISLFDDTFMTPVHIIGITLGVLGVGMLGAAFTRSGRGLVFPAIVLSLLGVLATGPAGWHSWQGAGELHYRPTTLSDVRGEYQRSVGVVDLDLTALPAESGTVRTSVTNNAGEVTIRVPANADVVAHCAAKAGHVDCLGRSADGLGRDLRVTDNGTDGPGGLRIELNASATVGNVEVRRD